MDKATVQKLKEAIVKSSSIGIAVGRDPSLDEMAAALAWYLLLKNANKRVSIASPNSPLVEVSSLVGINQVQTSLGGDAGDLVVSFPYRDGEIEKVSYTLDEEGGFLNIIVKAAENGLSFDEQDIRYTRGSGAVDLLFVIGTARLADLGDVIDSQKLRDIQVVNIDNKSQNQGFGDIVLVAPKLSSVSEQIADVALTLGFAIDQDAAQNLLSGIAAGTKNFQDPRTTSLAFEMTALLMKQGANRREVRETNNEQRENFGMAAPRPQPQQQPQQQQRPQPQNRPQDRQPQQDRPQRDAGGRNTNDKWAQQQRANAQRATEEKVQEAQDSQNGESDDEQPPVDWLTPKVYKGSSNV